MPMGFLVTGVAVLIAGAGVVHHRSRSTRDSITMFAAARAAMSTSAARHVVKQESLPQADPAPDAAREARLVIIDGHNPLLDPVARRQLESRRHFRSDPEALARRPTVALLPTLQIRRGETAKGA